jgi:hypothetical protein
MSLANIRRMVIGQNLLNFQNVNGNEPQYANVGAYCIRPADICTHHRTVYIMAGQANPAPTRGNKRKMQTQWQGVFNTPLQHALNAIESFISGLVPIFHLLTQSSLKTGVKRAFTLSGTWDRFTLKHLSSGHGT